MADRDSSLSLGISHLILWESSLKRRALLSRLKLSLAWSRGQWLWPERRVKGPAQFRSCPVLTFEVGVTAFVWTLAGLRRKPLSERAFTWCGLLNRAARELCQR